jgi:hypothetical protein
LHLKPEVIRRPEKLYLKIGNFLSGLGLNITSAYKYGKGEPFTHSTIWTFSAFSCGGGVHAAVKQKITNYLFTLEIYSSFPI